MRGPSPDRAARLQDRAARSLMPNAAFGDIQAGRDVSSRTAGSCGTHTTPA